MTVGTGIMASPVVAGKQVVPAVLTQVRDHTMPSLRQAITTLHPDLAHVAGYHCGLVDQHGRPDPGGGGKMLRPALVLLAARSVWAPSTSPPTEAVVAGAVAVQLVHEFSLLHDDIMDHDRVRRGRPTAWTVYGIDTAILTGDALLALAVSLLADYPAAEAVLAEAMVGLCAGQADDLTSRSRPIGTVADWERMAAGKTAALISAACRIGAVVAGADDRTATILAVAGTQLGLAFQARDDWLGIWGDPKVTGKPVGADIAARKHSLPITVALAEPGPAAHTLAAILSTDGDLTADDITAATMILDHAHADETTLHHVRDHVTRARACLAPLTVASGTRRDWDDLITFLTARTT
jgi:geranylgeranyl diphosphate synthase, type I